MIRGRRRSPQPDRTSACLERIRDLTEKLPVMVAPKWPRSRTQSIAVRGAEVKLPGEAWLGFEIERGADARPVLRPAATFRPRGLAGRAYRMLVTPLHVLVFGGLLRGLVDARKPPRRGFLRRIDTDVPRDPDR